MAGKTQMVNHHPGRLRDRPSTSQMDSGKAGPQELTTKKRGAPLTEGGVGALMTELTDVPGATAPPPEAYSSVLGRPGPGPTPSTRGHRSPAPRPPRGERVHDLRPPQPASHTRTRRRRTGASVCRAEPPAQETQSMEAQRHPGDVSATGHSIRVPRSQGLELCPTSKARKC